MSKKTKKQNRRQTAETCLYDPKPARTAKPVEPATEPLSWFQRFKAACVRIVQRVVGTPAQKLTQLHNEFKGSTELCRAKMSPALGFAKRFSVRLFWAAMTVACLLYASHCILVTGAAAGVVWLNVGVVSLATFVLLDPYLAQLAAATAAPVVMAWTRTEKFYRRLKGLRHTLSDLVKRTKQYPINKKQVADQPDPDTSIR